MSDIKSQDEQTKTIDIRKLLKSTLKLGSSDLHLVVGSEPQIRLNKELKALKLDKLTAVDVKGIVKSLLKEKQLQEFEENKELDDDFTIEDVGRFRANYYMTRDGMACAFRMIPIKIPSLEQFENNPILAELVKKEKGLILVTGATGSGKSTTLASMLNEINLTQRKHVITIESPIEFVHTNKKSLFSQRAVGTNTESFATAIKYALRQDPDVILIGEMRDTEEIEAALTAAETGHLVFGTLHTNSAPGTINRILDVFSPEKQPQVRAQLASSLVAVISQSIVNKVGSGRKSVQEILITNPAISNLIRKDQVHQLYSQMQLNQNETGMTTQTQELMKLLTNNIITKEEAIKISNRVEELKKTMEDY